MNSRLVESERKIPWGRALLGFLLAPLSAVIPVIIIALATGGSGIEFWFSIILPISYGASLLIGLPVFLILFRFGLNKLIYYATAGCLAALFPIFYVFFYGQIFEGASGGEVFDGILPIHYKIMGIMAFVAVMISIVFWLIVRPDRSAAS